MQPAAILGNRQTFGQTIAQQFTQHLLVLRRTVGRCEQALQQKRERLFVGGLGAVALGLQGAKRGRQAARQIHETGREVLLAGRIVPEEDRHAFVGRGLALQLDKVQGFARHCGGLRFDRDQLLVARTRGHRDLDVGDARVFSLGQIERHIVQRHALRIGLPLRRIAAPPGHGLDHRQPERLEFGAPPFRIKRDLRVDDDIGHRLAVEHDHAPHRVCVEHRAVERQGDRALRFDAPDHVVDESGLARGDALLMKGDRDGRRTMGWIDAARGEVLGRRADHGLRKLRVVQASGGEHLGRGQAAPIASGLVCGQRLQQPIGVARAALHEIAVHARREVRIETAAGLGRGRGQPDMRHPVECWQSGTELAAHEVLDMRTRRIEQHEIGAAPKRGLKLVGRNLLDETRLQGKSHGLRRLFQRDETPRLRRARGDDEHARGLDRERCAQHTGQHQQDRAPQRAGTPHDGVHAHQNW